MTTGKKIVIGLFVVYTVIISILLVVAGKRISVSNQQKRDYDSEIKIEQVFQRKRFDYIKNISFKSDSLIVILDRLSSSVKKLENSTAIIHNNYNQRINKLSYKSLDSLKIIALEI